MQRPVAHGRRAPAPRPPPPRAPCPSRLAVDEAVDAVGHDLLALLPHLLLLRRLDVGHLAGGWLVGQRGAGQGGRGLVGQRSGRRGGRQGAAASERARLAARQAGSRPRGATQPAPPLAPAPPASRRRGPARPAAAAHLGHGVHPHARAVDLDLVGVHGCGARGVGWGGQRVGVGVWAAARAARRAVHTAAAARASAARATAGRRRDGSPVLATTTLASRASVNHTLTTHDPASARCPPD